MLYNNLEFHNVAQLEKAEGLPGVRLQRFPESVRNNLGHQDHERGRFYSQKSVGCEIRFVTDARFFRISLSSVEEDGFVYIYKGNFLHSTHRLKAGVITTLHIEEPPRFNEVEKSALGNFPFSSDVWRILSGKECIIVFHYLDTFGHTVRPPQKSEVPSLKWLAYGSSITFGGNTTIYTNSYVQQAARRLGVDITNKAIAGSCFCDEVIPKFLSQECEWDFATLELGVNMRNRFTEKEFEERAFTLIKAMAAAKPLRPVFVISIYPNGDMYKLDRNNTVSQRNIAFNSILNNIVSEIGGSNLHLISGDDVLTDFSGLSSDLLHPSDEGHILMGENLSRILKGYNSVQPVLEKGGPA